jgi:hypothetical protein
MRITVEIPDELAQQMAAVGGDPARILLENFAVESYRSGKITMEQVRQLLGFGTRMQVTLFCRNTRFMTTRYKISKKTLLHWSAWKNTEPIH